jgi:predicted Zn-dependent protease
MILHACATEHVVQTSTLIRILTQEAPENTMVGADAAPLVTDARIVEPVVRVTTRLIASARRSEYGPRTGGLCWVIAVYQNAALPRSFVRPDGGIVVYTGTFRLAQTEAGLAALLSHELAHALTQEQIPVSPVCEIPTSRPERLFTREEEFKADQSGLTLMADAGYDPRELLRLWERMRREQDSGRDEALLHLTYDRRMEQIAKWLPDALLRYEHANRAPQKVLPMD